LPLEVDALHATTLALMVARRLGNCLVAPTISLGCSAHHMNFPGTISLQPATLEQVVVDCAVSLAAHGFDRICCFSAHGGNFGVLRSAEARLGARLSPDQRFIAFTDEVAFLGVWRQVVEQHTGRAHQVGGHSDIAESSVALALVPELVRPDLAQAGYLGPVDAAVSQRIRDEGIDALSQNGVIGDPTGMSLELGQACIDAMTAMLSSYFSSQLGENTTTAKEAR